MRSLACIFAFTLLAAPGSAWASPRESAEALLARALEGRVPGPPVECIDVGVTRDARVIDDTAILYDQGRTIFVTRPRVGRDILDDSYVLVSKPLLSRLCKGDVVQLRDSGSGTPVGAVRLEEFVPYRRPPRSR